MITSVRRQAGAGDEYSRVEELAHEGDETRRRRSGQDRKEPLLAALLLAWLVSGKQSIVGGTIGQGRWRFACHLPCRLPRRLLARSVRCACLCTGTGKGVGLLESHLVEPLLVGRSVECRAGQAGSPKVIMSCGRVGRLA